MKVSDHQITANAPRPKARKALWWFREGTSILFWLMLLSALVGCPLCNYAAIKIASVTGGNLIIAGLVVFGLVWMFGGNKAIWFTFFVISYPMAILIRVVPRFLVRHWPVLVIFLPGVRSILMTFRLRVGIGALVLAACLISLNSHNSVAQLVSWGALTCYLVWHYIRKFFHTYQSTTVYSQLADMLEKTSQWLPDSKTIRAKMREQQEKDNPAKKYAAGELLIFYGFSTALHYMARKLDDLHKSSRIDLYLMSSVVCSVILNITLFAVIYYGINRQAGHHFQITQEIGGWDFILFSFCNHFMSDLSPISPESGLARFFCWEQQIFAGFAGLLVGLALFTSCRERHSRDLETVVKKFENASEAMGSVFERDFSLTLAAVEQLMLASSPEVAGWLIRTRYGSNTADKLINKFKAGQVAAQQGHPVPKNSAGKRNKASVPNKEALDPSA